MEKKIQIKISDKHVLNGVLNSIEDSKKLIIFVHGLTGHKNEHQFYNAARFFTNEGFNTFRFDLYSDCDGCRRLRDCTVKTHSKDLETVIEYFRDDYEKIFLVGHSLGGPTILLSNHNGVSKVVLWDPSINIFKNLEDDLIFNEELGLYLLDWGVEFLVSREMVDDWKALDNRLIKYFIRPTKIICAQDGILDEMWKLEMSKIEVENDFVVVKRASHCFDEEGVELKLFEETLKWIEK